MLDTIHSQVEINGKNYPVLNSDYLNIDNCLSISAKSSCSISLRPKNNTPIGMTLKLVYTAGASHEKYQASQIFHFDLVNSSNGIMATNENITKIVAFKGNKLTIAIPFVLTDDFESLQVTSSILAQRSSLICPGGQYHKNSSCTALLSYLGGSYSGVITISGVRASFKNNSRNILKSNLGSQALFSTTFLAQSKLVANVISNGANVLINPADGKNKVIVNFHNSGLVSTSGAINVQSSNPEVKIIDSVSCLAKPLDAGGNCSIDLTATSSRNGQANISVKYNDGLELQTFSFNVLYVSQTPNVNIALTANGDFLNAIVNNPAKVNIKVLNNSVGGATLSNLSFTPIAGGFTYTGDSGGCKTDGSQTLKTGESCVLSIQYLPTMPEPQNVLKITASGKYTDSRGQPVSYVSDALAINYSAIPKVAHINFTPSEWNSEIRADNNDKSQQTFTLTNDGGIATTINKIINPTNQFVTIDNAGTTCLEGNKLEVNGSCLILIKFGASNKSTADNGSLTANYKPRPQDNEVSSSANVISKSSIAALIQLTRSLESSPEGLTGNGTSGSPYSFVATSKNQIGLKYVYKNVGMDIANNFALSANSMPFGYYIDTLLSTCPALGTVRALGIGESCQLVIKGVDTSYMQYFDATGSININDIGYSYSDVNTGVNRSVELSSLAYITVNQWGAISTTPSVVGKEITVTFTLTSLQSFKSSLAPVTIKWAVGSSGFSPSSASCQIEKQGSTCQIKITADASVPLGTYIFPYTASYNGSSLSGDLLRGYVSFSLN